MFDNIEIEQVYTADGLVLYFYSTDLLPVGEPISHDLLPFVPCEVCEECFLSPTYVYIIKSLRKADLLPEDYKLMCCYCYKEMKKDEL